MKNLVGSNHRLVQLYHPYYATPSYNMKNCTYEDNNTMDFVNGGLYESEGEDSFPGSPFSNPEQSFADDLNTIDFSDLFNIQKHEQEDPIQSNQLQIILDQVRRESLASLDSLENHCYDISPAHTPENSYAVKEEFSYPSPNSYAAKENFSYPSPNSYAIKEEFTYPSPNCYAVKEEFSYPSPSSYTQLQPMLPSPQIRPRDTYKTKAKSPPRRNSSHSDENDKIRLYEFVLQLLNEDRSDCIRWLCPVDGEFEITNSAKIAQLWGDVKKNPTMTYEKFARALRHYYKLGILINYKHKEKLRYKFSQEILLKNKKSLETNAV